MQASATPIDEAQRLKSLHALGILDTGPIKTLDELTLLAAVTLKMPVSLVTLVDRDCQWIKSRHGIEATQAPRLTSFCSYTILGHDTFVVNDAGEDPRFRDNPLVLGEPRIRFYAGHPVRAPDGHRIGALCVVDSRPRTFSDFERRVLKELTLRVEQEIVRLADAGRDPVTHRANRQGFESRATQALAECRRQGIPACLGVIDVDGFRALREHLTPDASNGLLKQFGDLLADTFRSTDIIGRRLAGEFWVFMPDATEAGFQAVLDLLKAKDGGPSSLGRAGCGKPGVLQGHSDLAAGRH